MIHINSIKSFELSDLLNFDADDDCSHKNILRTLVVVVALVIGTSKARSQKTVDTIEFSEGY